MAQVDQKRAKRARASGNAEEKALLQDLMAGKGVNKEILATVLRKLAAAPHVKVTTDARHRMLDAATDEFFESCSTSIELQLMCGTSFTWWLCDPNLLLGRTLAECPQLAQAYVHAMSEKPRSKEEPWSLIVVFDAFKPGSVYSVDSRKTMTLAFNFLEVGPNLLQMGSSWLIPLALRVSKIAAVEGGWSACLRLYLRLQLLGDLSLQTVGVPFTHNGQLYTVYAKLEYLMSDGEGLQDALSITGASGIRPCIRCLNVLMKNSDLAHRRHNFVEIGCANHQLFIESTTDDFNAEVDAVLQAQADASIGAMPVGVFNNLQKASGIKANPNGLVADLELRDSFSIIEVITEDWMHGCLQDGTVNVASYSLLQSWAEKADLDLSALERFLKSDLRFPKNTRNKMSQLWRVFGERSREYIDSEMIFKCQASELIGLYSLLRHFVYISMDDATAALLDKERRAFFAACRVVDLILKLKRGHANQNHCERLTRVLATAVDSSIALHIDAFGTRKIKPKHHRTQHIPKQIRKAKFVLDAFIIERLHLVVIDCLVCNTRFFEQSVLRGVCLKQITDCNTSLFQGLIGHSQPWGEGESIAQEMVHAGLRVAVGDVMLRHANAGFVTACISRGAVLYAIVEVWRFVAAVTPGSMRFEPTSNFEAWSAEELEQVIVFFVRSWMAVMGGIHGQAVHGYIEGTPSPLAQTPNKKKTHTTEI